MRIKYTQNNKSYNIFCKKKNIYIKLVSGVGLLKEPLSFSLS